MLPCNLGGDKHFYKLRPSPWNFLVFKCEWCKKYYYIPKFIFYQQMMALGVFQTKQQTKLFARKDGKWHKIDDEKAGVIQWLKEKLTKDPTVK